MKKILFLCAAGISIYACNNPAPAPADVAKAVDTAVAEIKKEVMPEAITYAYPVEYSSDFSMGDMQNAKKVLEMWKDYDDNTLNKHADYFADTVTFDMRDGSHMRYTRDSMMKIANSMRAKIASSKSSVAATTSLKANGKNESWVMVWGKEVDVLKNGKKDSVELQENWLFNKDGKVSWVIQYAKKSTK